jgi:hypothetical protein
VLSFLLAFPPKSCTFSSPMRATCSTHLHLLGLIWLIILVGKYKTLRSSLCNFLHSPVTSSLFGPNILLGYRFTVTIKLHYILHHRHRLQEWSIKSTKLNNETRVTSFF